MGSYCGFLILAERLYTYRSAFRRFNGANSPQYEKLTIGNALEKGMGGLGVEWNRRWEMKWSFTGCLCVDLFVRGLQPESEMEWLRGLWNGATKPPMLCGAEVGEMNWTQWSEGWTRSEARTASPETKWVKRMNRPQAHVNKTRPIFSYCNRWKGGGELCWFQVGGTPKQLTD